MAVIKPFRGIRYNPKLIEDMRAVISQPHDRIDRVRRQQYKDLSPYNIVRIIRVRTEEDRGSIPEGTSVYTRAQQHYEQWLEDGILIREPAPALYAHEQTFTIDDQTYVRMGLLTALKLTDFEEGIVLPHEKTHSGPKADRLDLICTLPVSAEPIFVLYPDPENKINLQIQQAINSREPDIDTTEMHEHLVRQRFWAITDPVHIQAIQDEMASKRDLIIADGHHRYTTGLNYRRIQQQANPDAPADANFNYIAATLVSMDDPGLAILPTHREIRNFTATSPTEILERADSYFAIAQVPDLKVCMEQVRADSRGYTYGFYGGPAIGFYTLSLRDTSLIYSMIDGGHSNEWKALTASVLHEILLEQVAEVPYSGIESREMIRYRRDPQHAVKSVDSGEANFAFFLSPTKMKDVQACVANHETMPQKSTDFYPKIIAGLAMLPLDGTPSVSRRE
ncbi:MAG: DUF1015 domain-containing protein [Anaerolineae bacterium]|nr:DUF1015 domain-containing protein [Anaerolineae bacterium]